MPPVARREPAALESLLHMSSPFYLAGSWERSNQPLPVTCPFDNSEVGATWLAGDAEFERATAAAVAAAETMRRPTNAPRS